MMVHAYCIQCSFYKAMKLLKQMVEKGMVPYVTSYNMTIPSP